MLDFGTTDICEATGCTVVEASADGARIQRVETDSRRVGPGALFVCFPGERVDGNDFAASAARDGASAILMTREATGEELAAAREAGCALLRAAGDDPEEFMLRLAAEWRSRNPQWAVVGVTGSVGKTTTKDMLAAGLGASWCTHATAGNFNNLIGVPITLLSADASDEVVVCEMGMNHAGELARLTEVVRPTLALVTNVGTSHIGFLGSREGIARAKAEIVVGIPASAEPVETCVGPVRSCLVLATDNDFAPLIEEEYCVPAGVEALRVAVGGAADGVCAQAADLRLDDAGHPSFHLAVGEWSRRMTLDVTGAATVADCVLAMAVAARLGADLDATASAIERMPSTHMRLEVVGGGDRPRVIDDSYNASPSSVAAALGLLSSLPCAGRRVAVLGEIGELGEESGRLHGLVGAYAAAVAPDLVVWVGGEAAHVMREAALVMGLSDDHMEVFPDAASALATIGPVLGPDDLVLAKGSRSVGLDSFVKGVLA